MKKHLFLVLALALALTACQKKEKEVDYEALSNDAALSQSMSSDVFKNVDNEAKNGESYDEVGKTDKTYKSNATCAQVTINSNGGNFPFTVTIDFGTGCTDAYLVTRKGKLIATFSGRYTDEGTVITVTTDNYYVNGYKVDGIKTITNEGRNAQNKMYFTVKDSNGVITKPDGKLVTWNAEYTQTWINGESTSFWTSSLAGICDDDYALEGQVSGVGSMGDTYSLQSQANKPLVKNVCCYWIQEGALDIYVNNKKTAAIDYGNGNCDAVMTLTYKNKDYQIIMW